jgi:hypothetical protein
MRQSVRRSVIAAVLGVAASIALSFTTAGAQSTPQFKLTPASGPVGTTVHFTGRVDPSEIEAFRKPAYFTLLKELPTCELLVDIHNPRISVDDGGTVSGSFEVGGTGSCFQQDHASRAVVTGQYNLVIAEHASFVGAFVITSGSRSAHTGGMSLTLIVAGILLIAVGLVFVLTRLRRA